MAGATLNDTTIARLLNEVARGRQKFSGRTHLTHALQEEVGELVKAQLQGRARPEIESEAIQVAAVALRIVEEGDADFDNLTEEEKQP